MVNPSEISRGRFLAAMMVLILVEALTSFEHVMIISALPLISRDYGLSQAAWTITLFLIIQASTAAIGARLGDMYGRARVLAWLLVLCLVGSVVSAQASGIGMVIAGRGLQGFSGAILPLCFGIARQIAPERSLPFWIGTLTGGYAVASAVGYVLGGHFVDLGSWRLIFWFAAAYALCVLPLLLLFVPRLPGSGADGRIDWLGAVLLAPGVAALLYGVTTVFRTGPISTLSAAAAIGGLALLIVWWIHELRQARPLMEVRLLYHRPVLIANVCGSIASLGAMQLPLVLMQYLQQPIESGAGLGVSATVAGLLKLPSNIVALGAAMFAGWLCGRSGSQRVVQLGGLICAVFWGLLIVFHDNQWQVLACIIGAAFGSTTLLAAVPNLVLEGTPPDRASEATGLSAVVRGLFSAVGSQIVTLILALSAVAGPAGRAYPSEAGYIAVFAAIAASGLVIALLAFAFRPRAAGRALSAG